MKRISADLWKLEEQEAAQLLEWSNAILVMVTQTHWMTNLLKATRNRLRGGGTIISEKQRALVDEITLGDPEMNWIHLGSDEDAATT